MASSFKAYMAGVGTVAVAIVFGFGGGLLIAQRFGSDTAVPEQSKIAKAKQDTNNQADIPQIPLSKPVVAETVGAALNNQPLTPAPQTLAVPAAEPAPTVPNQPQTTTAPPRQDAVVEASPPAQVSAPSSVPVGRVEPTQRQQIAPAPVEAPPPTKRRADKAPPKPDRRQAQKADTRVVEDEQTAAPEASSAEAAENSARSADSGPKSRRDKRRVQQVERIQGQRVDDDVRGARARAITDDDEIEDIAPRSDEPMEYRRTAPRPMMPPFFGLFGR